MPHIRKNTSTEIRLKVAVLVEHGGKLLLIREYHEGKKRYLWNTVKGSFEPRSDKDFIAAGRRESFEETRARVKITSLFSVLYTFKHEIAFVQVNLIAKLIGKKFAVPPYKEQQKFGEDIVEARLFTRAELEKMTSREFMGKRTVFVIREWLRRAPRYDLGMLKTIRQL